MRQTAFLHALLERAVSFSFSPFPQDPARSLANKRMWRDIAMSVNNRRWPIPATLPPLPLPVAASIPVIGQGNFGSPETLDAGTACLEPNRLLPLSLMVI